MSIRDRQVQRLQSILIDHELRAGRYPSLTAIQRAVAQAFAVRPAGRPRFLPQPVKAGQLSSPTEYNTMFTEVREDLEVATDEVFDQSRRMLAQADYYEMEKLRLSREMSRLATRVEGLLERTKAGALGGDTIFDSFVDFGGLEFTAQPDRNLVATTAAVDLAAGEVILQAAGRGQSIDLSEATARTQVKGTFRENRIEGNIENALTEYINQAWRQVVTRAEAGEFSLALTVELPEARVVSGLSIYTQMPKPATALLMITADGDTWKRVPITSQEQPLFWTFPSQKVKAFTVEFTKPEPDMTQGTEYRYHFGAQRIRLHAAGYHEEGVLVSSILPVGRPIEAVTLTVDQVLPPETSLRYYVAAERGGAPLQWQEIVPGAPLKLRRRDLLESFMAGPYGVGTSANGITLHQAGVIEDLVDVATLQVMAGESMWLAEGRSAPVDDSHIPSLADMVDALPEVRAYAPIEQATLPLATGLQRFTLWVNCPTERAESFRLTLTNARATVYLNNEQLRPIGEVYAYRFRAGWNQVVIHTAVSTGQTGSMTPRIFFADATVITQAHRDPMRQVSKDELLYTVSKSDNLAYAVEPHATGYRVLVNYDPSQVRYLVRYHEPLPAESDDLRFMALLSHSPKAEDATPRLRNYRLQVR